MKGLPSNPLSTQTVCNRETALPHSLPHDLAAVALPQTRRCHKDAQHSAQGINGDKLLASFNQLACITSHLSLHPCGSFHTLTIEDAFCGTRIPFCLNAGAMVNAIVDVDPRSIFAPVAEIGVYRLPSWKVARECPPAHTFHQHVENGVEQFSEINTAMTLARFRFWQ